MKSQIFRFNNPEGTDRKNSGFGSDSSEYDDSHDDQDDQEAGFGSDQ